MTAAMEAVKEKHKLNDLRRKGYRVSHGVFGSIAKFAELSETMNRLGTFGASLARLKKMDPSMSEMDAVAEAAFIARDVMDFDRAGSRFSTVIKLVPFLNPAIQGISKFQRRLTFAEGDRGRVALSDMRAFLTANGRDRLSDNERQTIAEGLRTWVRLGIYTSVLIGLKLLFQDHDEYKDVKDETLWTHSPVKIGDTWFRIPKAFEFALPANIAEVVIDWAYQRDPRLWSRIGHATKDAFLPPYMPQAFQLFMGGVLGERYDQKSGEARPIVRDDLARLPAFMQFDAYSSYLAIQLSKAANDWGVDISPAKIDFFLSAGAGYWGREIQTISNRFDPKREATQWTETPLIGTVLNRITIDPSRQSASVTKTWDLIARGKGTYDRALAGYQNIIKTTGGSPEAIKEYLGRLNDSEKTYAVLENHFSAEDKAKHPIHRAGNALRVDNAVRRELILGRLEDTSTKERRFITVPPAKNTEIQDILGRLNAVSAWNGLQVAKVPGWGERNIRHEQSILDELKASSETVYDEVMRRRRKAKVGDFEADLSRWQSVESRVKERIGDEDWLARQNARRKR
jgi:hypothetical protein